MTAVVPALNEADNLPHILPQVRRQVDEVILVDGGSTDRTCQVAAELVPDIRIIVQKGRGKGGAIGAGTAAASGDVIVLLDADGSMDPSDIPRYVKAIEDGADVVKGSRAAAGGGSDDLTRLRQAGNAGLRAAANLLLRTDWTELAYGYFALSRTAAEQLQLDQIDYKTADGQLAYGQGFEIETLIFTRAVRRGMTVVEIPSFEKERIHGSSNLRTFPDGWRVLTCLLKEAAAPQQPKARP